VQKRKYIRVIANNEVGVMTNLFSVTIG